MELKVYNPMAHFFKKIWNNKGFNIFLLLYSIFFISGAFILIVIDHGGVVLFINKLSEEWLDPIVLFVTDIGLGSFMVIVALLLSFWKVRYTLIGLLDLVIVGIFTNLLKKSFRMVGRPYKYLYYDDLYRFLHTTDLNYFSSFPSGHTMTVFACMSLLAYFVGKRWVGYIFFILALLVGFSRIYLLQHFFLDVYVGSILGVVATLISLWLAEEKLTFMKNERLNGSVIKLFKSGRTN